MRVGHRRLRLWHFLGIGLPLSIVLVGGCLAWQIHTYSFKSYTSGDIAIVLGAAVWGDRPSPVFEERIRHAIQLYQHEQIEAIIFTGGKGLDDQLTEAEVARRYALDRGVADSDIACETDSRVTYQNLRGAQSIVEAQSWETVLIISDPLHMRRAMTMARDLGLPAYPAPTPTSRYQSWRTKGRFLLREVFFYASYLLRRGWNQQIR